MPELALSSWSFHRNLEETLSILAFPRLATSFEISNLEICQHHLASTEPEYLATVRAAVDSLGCRVVNVPIDVGNLAEPDTEQRDREIERILPWIDAAHLLSSPAVRVNTGRAGERSEAELLPIVAEGYRRLAAYCAEHGMMILLENHGGLSASPRAIMALLEAVGAPNFRLCPDFGNFAPEVREDGLRLMLPHAAVVHAKVMDIDEQGRHPAFDLARCLALVEESGFAGPLSIEFEGKDDEYQGVARAREFVRSHLRPSDASRSVSTTPRPSTDATGRWAEGRVALVGAGMIAHNHVRRWREAGAEVVAVADVNPGTLATFADKHGIEARHADYQPLLAEDGFDIVDICTPPWLHAPIAIAALEAGKHVLCEKPIALTTAEAEAMADAADAAGKVLACRQGATRLAWQARTVRDAVQSGVLGEVYFMRLVGRSLYRPGIEYNPLARWFLDRSKAGGGALYDLGVYDLELLFGIFGPLEVADIIALTFRGVDRPDLDSPFDVEEHAVAMVRLRSNHQGERIAVDADGATAYWERAWATHLPPEHRWELYGTETALSFVPHSEIMGVDMDLRLTRYSPDQPAHLPPPPQAPPGPSVYEDFLLAVAGERRPACSGREAAAILRIIEQIYSAATPRQVRPPTLG